MLLYKNKEWKKDFGDHLQYVFNAYYIWRYLSDKSKRINSERATIEPRTKAVKQNVDRKNTKGEVIKRSGSLCFVGRTRPPSLLYSYCCAFYMTAAKNFIKTHPLILIFNFMFIL